MFLYKGKYERQMGFVKKSVAASAKYFKEKFKVGEADEAEEEGEVFDKSHSINYFRHVEEEEDDE